MNLRTKSVFGLLAPVVVFLALALGAPAPAQAGCPHSGESVRSISKGNARAAIGCLFNKERSAENVEDNGDLHDAAQNHAATMAAQNCYSHQCSGEGDLRERVARTGYLRGASDYELGEVILIAKAKASSRQIVNAWMNSPGHNANITKSSYDHVGVGLSIRNGRAYVSGDFGSR